jgi:phage gp29-like protein
MAIEKSMKEEIASRQRSRDYANFNMYLPNPDPVLKKQGKDIEIYKELRSDAHVGADILKRKAGVRSLEWELSGDDTPALQFVQECFNKLDIYRLITEALDATLFGYRPLEVIWEKRGEYIAPAKVEGKPSEWFRYSPENELLFLSKDNWQGEAVPRYKFIVARNEPSYENPYGMAALSACFWPVVFKRGGMKFWVTFTEKYGMPYMIGKYARGTDSKEIDALLLSLDNMIQDAVAAIPDDSSVSILEAGGKGATADIYEKLLHFCNAEISKAIVGQTLTTEMGSSGSFAASKTHKEVLQDVIDSDARMIESAMNELIGWIVTLNFADADAPKFVMFEKEDVDKTLAERDTQLVNGGVRFTKKYYTRAYGFKDDEIEVTDPQAATKMSEFRFSESKPIDTLDAKSREVDTTSIEDEILNALDSALASSESYEEAFETLLEDFPQLSLDRLQEAITHLGANATILGGGEVADEQQ